MKLHQTTLLICAAALFATGNIPAFLRKMHRPPPIKLYEVMMKREPGIIRTPAVPLPLHASMAREFSASVRMFPSLYHIPAVGNRPMEFSADDLPDGLDLGFEVGHDHRKSCSKREIIW